MVLETECYQSDRCRGLFDASADAKRDQAAVICHHATKGRILRPIRDVCGAGGGKYAYLCLAAGWGQVSVPQARLNGCMGGLGLNQHASTGLGAPRSVFKH